jgi:hypothetical protein
VIWFVGTAVGVAAGVRLPEAWSSVADQSTTLIFVILTAECVGSPRDAGIAVLAGTLTLALRTLPAVPGVTAVLLSGRDAWLTGKALSASDYTAALFLIGAGVVAPKVLPALVMRNVPSASAQRWFSWIVPAMLGTLTAPMVARFATSAGGITWPLSYVAAYIGVGVIAAVIRRTSVVLWYRSPSSRRLALAVTLN